jgi:DNA mismatch endonuclease, patch repair protein
VVVDGCFWQGHPRFFTRGKSGRYWDEKIQRNRNRDRKTNRAYRRSGWEVIRLWDFEVENDAATSASVVARVLRKRKEGHA